MVKLKKPFLIATLILLISTPLASAHTTLISSNPKSGGVLTSLPTQVSLNFAEPLLDIKGKAVNSLQLLSPNKEQLINSVTVAKNQLIGKVNGVKVQVGAYVIKYRVVAQDGHVLVGSYSFKIS